MNLDEMTAHFKKFTDLHGLISPNGSHSGNGLMYTAPYFYLLHKEKRYPEMLPIADAYQRCRVPGGGFNRQPYGWYSKHYNAPDDYFGIGLFASVIRKANIQHDATFTAEAVLSDMRKNYGVLNNLNPGVFRWKSWLGRMPHLICHLQFAAGERPNVFRIFIWALALLVSLFKLPKSRDSHVKAWMMCKVAQGINPYIDSVISIWRFFFKKRFPGGYGQVEKIHGFPADHPSIKYLWGDY